MPRRKDRYHGTGTTSASNTGLDPEDTREVKICFRAPRILRTKVKEFVTKNNYRSENRVYEEATWKFISNHDYALQVKETIERSSKYIFEQIKEEYELDFQRVNEVLTELVENLRKISEPLISAHQQLREDLEKTLEKGRYQIQTWIVYFIGLHKTLTRDRLLQLVLNEVTYPRWLVDDALALLVQNKLLKETPQGTFSLQTMRT